MSDDRERFEVAGVGCWCPDSMTLATLRLMGHTVDCTNARRGWRANYAHLGAIDQQRRIDAEVGRQIREAAAGILAAAEKDVGSGS